MDGLLLIDKPAGMTSHDVVDRVRKVAKTRRVGHAGTLDPFATGLLIVGINKGTKKLATIVGLDKTYEATARLGATSTTDDLEGEIVEQIVTRHPTQEEIERVCDAFRGGYLQTAPLFSAKRVDGKRLYQLARKGTVSDVVLPAKQVSITELTITTYAWPTLSFTVSCGSGTYIRALARDMGAALNCGAYLTALRRTKIADYDVRHAVVLADLNETTLNTSLISL